MLLKILLFILQHHASCPGLGLSPRNVKWLSKDDLRDSSSWSSSSLLLLREIHVQLLTQYDFKEVCTRSQSQVNVGTSARLHSQDDVSQQPGTVPLSLPSLITSLILPLYGMRGLSPMLTLLSSPHIVRIPNRSSTTGSPSLTSNLCLRTRVTLNR
jgi:hypothetical protein